MRLSQIGALCGPPQLAHDLSGGWDVGGGVVAARISWRMGVSVRWRLVIYLIVERPTVGYPVGSVVSVVVAELVSVSGRPP